MNELTSMEQFFEDLKEKIKASAGVLLFRQAIGLITLIAGISCAAVPLTALSQEPQDNRLTTWEELDREASTLAESVSFLAAEITDETCKEVHGLAPELTLAIGSSFKLYILGELAQQITGRAELAPYSAFQPSTRFRHDPFLQGPGRLGWEDPLEIQKQYKSPPDGPLVYVPDGSPFTIRYFAEQMIQRSDNTATDHLLFLLGRENVERRMAEMGHHDPTLNRPLFATREFFIAKLLWTDEELAAYLAASDAERREMLANEKQGYRELVAYWSSPTRIDTVEYFANRFDMCKALMALHDMAQEPGLRPVTEVLTLEDGIGIDREDWIYVGHKGGSEPGVLAANWLLQRNDGRLFVISWAFNDTAHTINVPPAILQAAVDILFQTP